MQAKGLWKDFEDYCRLGERSRGVASIAGADSVTKRAGFALISNVIVPPQRSSIAARTRSSGSEFCAVKLQAKAPAASSGHERAHIHPQGHLKKNYDTTRSSEPTP